MNIDTGESPESLAFLDKFAPLGVEPQYRRFELSNNPLNHSGSLFIDIYIFVINPFNMVFF